MQSSGCAKLFSVMAIGAVAVHENQYPIPTLRIFGDGLPIKVEHRVGEMPHLVFCNKDTIH